MRASSQDASTRFCHTAAVPPSRQQGRRTPTTANYARLALYVRKRREQLHLTQADVTTRGGPSEATQRLIENVAGGEFRPATYRQLEDALDWARGSSAIILEGGEPTIALAGGEVPEELRRSLDALASMRPHVRRAVASLVEALAQDDDDSQASSG